MSWPTLPFEDVVEARGSGSRGLAQSEWQQSGAYPVIGQGAEPIEGRTDRADLLITPSPAVVLYGGHTRRAKYVDTPFVPGPNVKILEPSGAVDAKYLYWFLAQLEIESRGYADHFPQVRRCEVPVPPLLEQKRIAAILDAADDLRAKRRESIKQLDSLAQTTFLETFGDPVTNPKGWNAVSIAAAPLHIGDGNYSSKYPKAEDFVSTGVPFIRANNLDDGTICDEDMKFISRGQHSDLTKGHLEANDILVTTRGDIGRVARVPERHAGSNINAQLVLLRCLDNTLNAHFLGCQLGLPGMLAYIKTHQTGVALKQLPIRSLRSIRIISPPPFLQARFASIVESIEHQKTRLKAHLAELDTLFASLQSRAFNGELVA